MTEEMNYELLEESLTFDDLGLSKPILRAINELGFTKPTIIQERSIPAMKEGHDILGRSKTGSGKTLAFGAPAIEMIDGSDHVQVLILCPTRELATQVSSELKKFAKYKENVRICAIYGGQPIDKQIFLLKKKANIVVGTPGRVMDHMRRHTLKLKNLKMMVLDEADEMLNMGFREDIETILQEVPETRQTALFSATIPPAIKSITKTYLSDPILVEVGKEDTPVETIKQYYYNVPRGRKEDVLELLLHRYEPKLSMIFCNTKKMVDLLTEELSVRGFRALGLHGDMKQSQRTTVMDSFKSGRTPILIATDVAARGIDVENIDAVFNYDLPTDYEYYIHRIGRTGRAGKDGVAYTLISGHDQKSGIKNIMYHAKTQIEQMPIPAADEVLGIKYKKIVSDIIDKIEEGPNSQVEKIATEVLQAGYTYEHLALALLKDLYSKKKLNLPVVHVKAPINKKLKGESLSGDKGKIKISSGRNAGIQPNFIVGAIVEQTGIEGRSIGKIEIYPEFTSVEIPMEYIDDIITAMNHSKINGKKVTVEKDVRGMANRDKRGSNKGKKFDDKPYDKKARDGKKDRYDQGPKRENKKDRNDFDKKDKPERKRKTDGADDKKPRATDRSDNAKDNMTLAQKAKALMPRQPKKPKVKLEDIDTLELFID